MKIDLVYIAKQNERMVARCAQPPTQQTADESNTYPPAALPPGTNWCSYSIASTPEQKRQASKRAMKGQKR